MQFDIVPEDFVPKFPRMFSLPFFFDEDEGLTFANTGFTLSEDDKNVYVQASLPGIDPKDITVTFDKGILRIHGELKEEKEDKKIKYYHKATRAFNYRIRLPETVNETVEPEVTGKNGMLKVAFEKTPKTEPKKLKVKEE